MSINFESEYDQNDLTTNRAVNSSTNSNSLNNINKLIIDEKIEEDDTEYVRVSKPIKPAVLPDEFNFYSSPSPKTLTNNTNSKFRGSLPFLFACLIYFFCFCFVFMLI